jgi:superfamily I DNA/RNA helicase
VDLVTNYRCPAPVVERAVRLVEHNEERFAKRIVPRAGAAGRLVLAPDTADETVRVGRILDSWPDDGGSRAILARTNRELLPAVAVCLERGIPFRAAQVPLVLESEHLDGLLDRVAADATDRLPLLALLGRLRESLPTAADDDEAFDPRTVAEAMLAWAPAFRDAPSFVAAVRERRDGLAALRSDDAPLTLATAHGTKGLEFDFVAVVGMEAGRFPSRRSVSDAEDPDRALEEERRLAYVAWTRARRSLTLSYDPTLPSPFLLEAFGPDELGVPSDAAA